MRVETSSGSPISRIEALILSQVQMYTAKGEQGNTVTQLSTGQILGVFCNSHRSEFSSASESCKLWILDRLVQPHVLLVLETHCLAVWLPIIICRRRGMALILTDITWYYFLPQRGTNSIIFQWRYLNTLFRVEDVNQVGPRCRLVKKSHQLQGIQKDFLCS